MPQIFIENISKLCYNNIAEGIVPVGKTGEELSNFKPIDWDSMTFSNNLVFLEVMKNKELCKRLIEQVLYIHIREIFILKQIRALAYELTASGFDLMFM